ncbi:MAG: 2-C-methyl-D-erythritol 2,4-cyclodiphosphate synthase [Clostridiales bacterium]|nr:2-C-methyl-D-erythritol 2,4-cyclodiphosphate synthase [Clostridiales bacterium]
MEYAYISAIGQDSHRFEHDIDIDNKIVLGGVEIPNNRKLSANSDGDVILHALTNAVSGYTTVNVLGYSADKMCLEQGITDSRVYLAEALSHLGDASICHVSVSVECLVPKLKPHIPAIRTSIAGLLGMPETSVGITATTGERLTGPGRGEGISVFAVITVKKPLE